MYTRVCVHVQVVVTRVRAVAVVTGRSLQSVVCVYRCVRGSYSSSSSRILQRDWYSLVHAPHPHFTQKNL